MKKDYKKILDIAKERLRNDTVNIIIDLLGERSFISAGFITVRFEDDHAGGGRLIVTGEDREDAVLRDLPLDALTGLAETLIRHADEFSPRVDFPEEVRRAFGDCPAELSGDDLAERIRRERGLTMEEARAVALAVEGRRARGKA